MQRRHFVLIADAIIGMKIPKEVRIEVVNKLTKALRNTNEHFDHERFAKYIETSIDKNTIVNTKKSTTWDI
jgi:hypothetical protein